MTVTIGNRTIQGLNENGFLNFNTVMYENLASIDWASAWTSASPSQTTASNGYFKLNGLIYNWGYGLAIPANSRVYFNYYFTFNTVYAAMLSSKIENTNDDRGPSKIAVDWYKSLETTRIRILNTSDSTRYHSYIAIGV